MSDIVKFNSVEEFIIELRGQKVILDSNVATLYGVETREINQAVRNNPDKFPDGYIIEVSKTELVSLRSKILTLKTGGRGQHTKYAPKAFTEKGLYMLATILKGERPRPLRMSRQSTNQRRVFHLPVQVAQFIKPGPKLQYGCIARTPVRNRTATVGTGIRNSIH